MVYIGDSLMSVYNRGQHQFKSKEQTRGFNQPYQVGTRGDNPQNCVKEEMIMAEGSIIITGSDGVWDNLFDQEITQLVVAKAEMSLLA